jgi:8-amino-7-oxononanoate synthase
VLILKPAAERPKFANPFFRTHEGVACATSRVDGREYINFSSHNDLGLSGHPAVNQAARKAIDRYGTSVSANRLVTVERPVQRELEEALAHLYEVEDCIFFVSGLATNVSTSGDLFGPKDWVIHNSVLEGIKPSGSARRSFQHNDTSALYQIFAGIRCQFKHVPIVAESLYSIGCDIPDLPVLFALKRRHKDFLMVNEAHSIGMIGESGRCICEHYGMAGKDVDVWMGTHSKTLAGCGGYIAGERAMVEQLRYAAPGIVDSVGMAPPLVAASLEALNILLTEPERVSRFRQRASFFSVGRFGRHRNRLFCRARRDPCLCRQFAQGNQIVQSAIRCRHQCTADHLSRRRGKPAHLRFFISVTTVSGCDSSRSRQACP